MGPREKQAAGSWRRRPPRLVAEERREEIRMLSRKREEKKLECFRKRKKKLFKFLNEGQNGPFNKLLGAPSISLWRCDHIGSFGGASEIFFKKHIVI